MGVCQSAIVQQQIETNRRIEREQQVARKENRRSIKLLFLGPGESGKSTVLKQLRLLKSEGFTKAELLEYRRFVYSNIFNCAAALIGATESLGIPIADPYLQEHKQLVFGIINTEKENEAIGAEVYRYLKHLWADEGIQECYRQRSKFQINDAAKYFLDKIDEIYKPTYIPTEEDAIRVRATTIGVVELMFHHKNLSFRVIDVGGQRSERRKWIHQFDKVNSIIFMVAMSEYDQMMREDNLTNRILDAKTLFEKIINSEWFEKTQVILFLNKRDLFAQKIENKVPITIAFPEYKGALEYEACAKFIGNQFLGLNQRQSRTIAVHETCATDGNQIKKVVSNVMDVVIEANMKGATATG